nr:DUF397 domain-containing protein [Streptomyces sp. LBL]
MSATSHSPHPPCPSSAARTVIRATRAARGSWGRRRAYVHTYGGDGSNCVEIATPFTTVHIRDSKNPEIATARGQQPRPRTRSRCQSLDVSSMIINYTGERTDPIPDRGVRAWPGGAVQTSRPASIRFRPCRARARLLRPRSSAR